jgi:hypothetical protein
LDSRWYGSRTISFINRYSMNLTRNFTLSELTKSDTAIRKGINNNPSAEQIEKLKSLCENILQPVRDHFGRVKITSGFRSVELCMAIGSSANSQHAKAEAASSSSTLRVNLTADGYIAAIPKEHHELVFYMHLDQKVKQNTNLS